MGENDIYLNSEFLEWRWFTSTKTLHVFIWLLVNAENGSVDTKNEVIAEECGMTVQNVRTALANLQKTGDIRRERKRFSQVITIVDYDRYTLCE